MAKRRPIDLACLTDGELRVMRAKIDELLEQRGPVRRTLVMLTHGDDFNNRTESYSGVTYDEARDIVQSKIPNWVDQVWPRRNAKPGAPGSALHLRTIDAASLPEVDGGFTSFEVRASSSDRDALIALWGTDPVIKYQAYENKYLVVVDGKVLFKDYV
jgi:hypothetical protein